MKKINGAKVGIIVLLVLIAIYLVAIGGIAWGLMTSGEVAPIIMGFALIIFPVVGVYVVIRDLQFVHRANRLVERMAQDGELPEDDLPRQPSGRVVRAAADADFEQWKARVEVDPGNWRSWVLLGLAYRASGDTPRARQAMRRAIELEQAG